MTSNDFFTKNDAPETDQFTNFSTKIHFPEIAKIKLSHRQINTGNIGIDFTNPIYQGTFNSVHYTRDSSDKLRNLLDSTAFLNPDLQIVGISFSKTDLAPKTDRPNFTEVVPASDAKEDILKTMSIVFEMINEAHAKGKNLMLVFDDSVSVFYQLYNFYHYSKNEAS